MNQNNNIQIKELLSTYKETYRKILEVFDTSGWESIQDHTNTKWKIYDDNIAYVENECEYSYEYVSDCGIRDNYQLFYIQDNGDSFYGIFNLNNKDTD